MALPDIIRIGGIDYKVSEINSLRDDDDGIELDGQIVYNKCEIRIRAGVDPQHTRAILWHEVAHGILAHAGMDHHDEQVVGAIAYGLIQVLQDNPWLREIASEIDE